MFSSFDALCAVDVAVVQRLPVLVRMLDRAKTQPNASKRQWKRFVNGESTPANSMRFGFFSSSMSWQRLSDTTVSLASREPHG